MAGAHDTRDELSNVHATAISLAGRCVLIRGPSGAGKSDLALRCLSVGHTAFVPWPARLVADDRVLISRRGSSLIAGAPPSLHGRLEVRGLGIVDIPYDLEAEAVLFADLVAPAAIERMPETPETFELCGVQLPVVKIAPFEASAPVKLLIALYQCIKGPSHMAGEA